MARPRSRARWALAAALIAVAGCSANQRSIPASPAQSLATRAARSHPDETLFNWLQPGINAAHTADNMKETRLTRKNVAKLTQAWSFGTGGEIGNPIVTDGSTAFADSGDGFLYAIDATTGAQKWSFETYAGDAWATSPAISGNLIYAPCKIGGNTQKQGLCAIDKGTGKRKWAYYNDCSCQPPSGVEEGPVIAGSTVVIGFYDKDVYYNYTVTALDASSGKVLWQVLAGTKSPNGYGLANSPPAIDNGNVFVGSSGGICSYQLANGAVNWCSGPDDGGTAPAVSNGVVYVNTFSHGVYALNETTGAQMWQYGPQSNAAGGYDDPPAIANGTVYVSGIDQGYLFALDASTGTLVFDTSGDGAGAYTTSSPSVANGVVYVACNTGLCAFNGTTGKLLAAVGSGASNDSQPAVASGRVYGVCGYNDACMYDL